MRTPNLRAPVLHLHDSLNICCCRSPSPFNRNTWTALAVQNESCSLHVSPMCEIPSLRWYSHHLRKATNVTQVTWEGTSSLRNPSNSNYELESRQILHPKDPILRGPHKTHVDQVLIDESKPDRCLGIRANLESSVRNKLIEFLKEDIRSSQGPLQI